MIRGNKKNAIKGITIGFEFEGIFKALYETAEKIREETENPNWAIHSDSSVRRTNSQIARKMMGGHEIVSPVFHGLEEFEQGVKAVLRIGAEKGGVETSSGCGFHIHFGFGETVLNSLYGYGNDFVLERLRLVLRFSETEPFIDRFLSRKRKGDGTEYAKTNKMNFTSTSPLASFAVSSGGMRYRKLNLESLEKHNTIEVRALQGSTNPDLLIGWGGLMAYMLSSILFEDFSWQKTVKNNKEKAVEDAKRLFYDSIGLPKRYRLMLDRYLKARKEFEKSDFWNMEMIAGE